MKIGILTYHAVYNFGANLQALSTFNFLKNTGHEPIIIDFFPQTLEEAFDKSVPIIQANAHKKYLRDHFKLTTRCRNAIEIANEIEVNNIEAVIIGSDAVTQHNSLVSRIQINPSFKTLISFRIDPIHYETNFPNPFWGEFIQYLKSQIPVVMMSVSCQNTDYSSIRGKTKKSINIILKQLSYVSVRDKRTQELFMHVSKGGCIPKITPDPVFAFNDNVTVLPTKAEILEKFQLQNNYILLSFNSSKTVSASWIASFETIAKQKGYQCVALAMPGGIKFAHNLGKIIDIPLDPLDWYSLIKYSSAYVGEKMHPIVVSLHNSVPFYSFDHYGILKFKLFLNQKASKIYQILVKANLNDHRVSIVKRINYKAPLPEYVFEKLTSFNKEKCTVFANSMKTEYKNLMNEIIRVFQ